MGRISRKKQNFPIKKSPTDLICKRRIYSVVPLFLKTNVFHSMRVTNAYESAYLFRPSAKCVPQTSSRMHFHHHPNKNAFSRWRFLSVMLIMMYSFRSSLFLINSMVRIWDSSLFVKLFSYITSLLFYKKLIIYRLFL